MHYALPFIESIGAALAEVTVASLTVPDVAGNRFRLRGLSVGGGSSAADRNMLLRIRRIESAPSAGTGSSAVTPSKKDPGSVASIITAKVGYTAAPASYATVDVWSSGANHRGSIIKEWEIDDAPIFTRDQLCGLVAYTPGAVVQIIGSLEFEVF